MRIRKLLSRVLARREEAPESAQTRPPEPSPLPPIPATPDVTNALMELTGQGLWYWNLLTGGTWLSPAFCRLLGYTPEDAEPAARAGFRLIHPSDMPAAIEQLLSHFGRRSPFIRPRSACAKKTGNISPSSAAGWSWNGIAPAAHAVSPESIPF